MTEVVEKDTMDMGTWCGDMVVTEVVEKDTMDMDMGHGEDRGCGGGHNGHGHGTW